MKFYKENEKSKAICEKCKEIVVTTFQVRDVPFSKSKGTVKNILVSVCDKCDEIVAIPHQSSIKIKERKEQKPKSLEARLPYHISDILYAATHEINGSVPVGSLSSSIFKFYIHHLAKDKRRNKKLVKYSTSKLFSGKSKDRFSIKLNESVMEEFVALQNETKLNKSNLMKSIILLINDDINNKKYPGNVERLKEISIAL